MAGIYVHPNFSPKRSAYAFALICSALSFLISLVDMINIDLAETSLASVGGSLCHIVIGSAGALFLSVIGTFKLKVMERAVLLKYRKTSPPTTFPFAPPKPPPPTDEQVAEMIEQIRRTVRLRILRRCLKLLTSVLLLTSQNAKYLKVRLRLY